MTRKLRRSYFISLAVIFTFEVIILIVIVKLYWTHPILGYGSTGQIYEFVAEIACTVNNLVIGTWMFLSRRECDRIVKGIISIEKKVLQIPSSCNKSLKVLAFCTLIFIGNSVFIRFIYKNQLISSMIIFTYEVDFVRTFTFLTFYSLLSRSIQLSLERINHRLEGILKRLQNHQELPIFRCCGRIETLLELRRQLLMHCRSDLSYIFGLPLLFISSFLCVELIQCPFYFVTAFDRMKVFTLGKIIEILGPTLFWITPKIIIALRIFRGGAIEKEVMVFKTLLLLKNIINFTALLIAFV